MRTARRNIVRDGFEEVGCLDRSRWRHRRRAWLADGASLNTPPRASPLVHLPTLLVVSHVSDATRACHPTMASKLGTTGSFALFLRHFISPHGCGPQSLRMGKESRSALSIQHPCHISASSNLNNTCHVPDFTGKQYFE